MTRTNTVSAHWDDLSEEVKKREEAMKPDADCAVSSMRIFDCAFFGDEKNGYLREYEWDEEVEILDGIVGRIRCPGCGRDGPKPLSSRNNNDLSCIECKDTGAVLVSI